MKAIGKKEIKEALDNFVFNKEKYHGYELDTIILKYNGFDINGVLLEEPTELSNEFDDIGDVYLYIDKIMNKKGYLTDDLELYVKK